MFTKKGKLLSKLTTFDTEGQRGTGSSSNEALSSDTGGMAGHLGFRQAHQASFRSTVSDSEVDQSNVRVFNNHL